MESPFLPMPGIGIASDGDQLYCFLSPYERSAFDKKDPCLDCGAISLSIEYPYGVAPLVEDEVKVMIGHELCHVKHSDVLYRQLALPFAGSATLLAGKAMRVAGASKKLAVTGAVGLLFTFLFAQKKMAQFQEERADRYAATTPEKAALAASYLKKMGLPGELKQMQEFRDQGASEEYIRWGMLIVNRFTSNHPLPSERIAYLEEIAGI